MAPARSRTAHPDLSERYRVLLDIGRRLAGTLTLEDLYRAIHEETAQVLETSGFHISVYDQARDVATVVFHADHAGERLTDITYRGSDSDVILTGRAMVMEGEDEVSGLLAAREDGDGPATVSAMMAPLRHSDRVLGAICVRSDAPEAYSEDDLELLQGIADIAAISIENAHFVSELERRRREAEKLEEIGRALTASLDSQEVLGKVVEAVLDVVAADGATVWLLESGDVARVGASGGEIGLPQGAGWHLEGPLLHRLARQREPVLIEDLEKSDLIPDDLREHLQAGSGVAVPMVAGDRVVGALSAGSRRTRYFSRDDIEVLGRIATQAALALHNARLHQGLRTLSRTDELTGLANRRHLQFHLNREVAAALRGRSVALVIFDIDNFKTFNDTLGHPVGDEILRSFADILMDENRAMNLVARYGGDEFISVLSDADIEGARGYVRRIHERLSEHPVLARHGVTVTSGIACFDASTMSTATDLLQAADEDLYRRRAERGTGR